MISIYIKYSAEFPNNGFYPSITREHLSQAAKGFQRKYQITK